MKHSVFHKGFGRRPSGVVSAFQRPTPYALRPISLTEGRNA